MAEIADLAKAALRAWRPPEKLSLSEWADKHFVLSAESSAEAGRWHTLPYQKGIMDAVTDPTVEQISVMKSARVGYSKILNACIAFHIHQDPCPMMLVQPTIEDAQGFSKEEIAPMLRDVPALRGLVSESKAKDGANTILQKQYPGGTLGLVGANSPRGFRRVSRRIVMFDETDGYPPSAGAEGDQIKLGIRRTEYYWNRKIIAGSTPTLKDASRIERLFAQGDQRRYFVPCPDCGHMQYLKWSGMQWHEPTDPVHYLCEDCGVLIPHSKKRWMVERGEWRPTAPGNGKHVSFHVWAAYSYSPNASWDNLRDEFLEAKNDAEALKTFVNTVLGESWEDDYAAKVGADSLLERAEAYEPQIIPAEASALTIGCDVQGNRLSLSVWAWGREEEGWLIDRVVIHGDPSRPEPWKQLDEIVSRPFPHALGCELKPDVVCIDSGGHHTMEVYQYARERQNLGVIAVKGQSHKGRPPIGKPTKVDLNCKGRALKKGAEVFPVGSDTIKSLLFGRLKHNEVGPGYLHFYAKVGLEYFEELTAEKQITRFVRGYPERVWVKKSSQHNEALDELVYAYAALNRMYQRYDRRTMWDQLEKRLEKSAESESKAPLRSNKAPKRSFVRQW